MNKSSDKSIFNFPLEYSFAAIALIFGILIAIYNPPFQSNDEDRHFLRAYAMASGQFAPVQGNDKAGAVYPANLLYTVQSFQGIPFHKGAKVNEDHLEQALQTTINAQDTTFYIYPYRKTAPLAYLPPMIGIAAGKAVSSNPVWLNRFARIFGLLAFIALVFFAIRWTPVYKHVFFILALTPMTLYQAASVSYDSVSIALAFLMVAAALKFAFSETEITGKELAMFLIIAVFHRYAKDGYFLLPFLIFIVNPKKFGSQAKYFATWAVLLLLYFLPQLTWVAYINSLDLHGFTQLQKDFLFSQSKNLDYQLANPGMFFSNMIDNILYWKQDWLTGALGKFGYAYAEMPAAFIALHGLAIIIIAFLSNKKEYVFTSAQKIIIALISLGSLMLIIVGFYIVGSPVGAAKIFGLQGRYFLPILPVLMLLLCNGKYEFDFFRKKGNLLLSIYSVIILIYTLTFINNYYYE